MHMSTYTKGAKHGEGKKSFRGLIELEVESFFKAQSTLQRCHNPINTTNTDASIGFFHQTADQEHQLRK